MKPVRGTVSIDPDPLPGNPLRFAYFGDPPAGRPKPGDRYSGAAFALQELGKEQPLTFRSAEFQGVENDDDSSAFQSAQGPLDVDPH